MFSNTYDPANSSTFPGYSTQPFTMTQPGYLQSDVYVLHTSQGPKIVKNLFQNTIPNLNQGPSVTRYIPSVALASNNVNTYLVVNII